MKRSLFLFSFFIVSLCVNKTAAQNFLQLGKSPVKEVVTAMMLEEKAKLVVSNGLNMADLASFYTDKESWIADAGNYEVKAGASSTDIRLSATFNLPAETVVEKVDKAVTAKGNINELKKQNASPGTGYIEELNSFVVIGQ